MGRNIWQSEHPAAMIQAIHGIVKNGLNVKEALQLYEDVKIKTNYYTLLVATYTVYEIYIDDSTQHIDLPTILFMKHPLN